MIMRCGILVTVALAATMLLTSSAQRSNTTRKGRLKPVSESRELPARTVVVVDSVSPDSVVIDRYDKPLRSLRETFFVTNHYSDTVVSLRLMLRYDAVDGTMLHSRRATINCDVPPGETRQLYLTAWDRQFTYYYNDTRIRPRSSKAVPYTVVMNPEAVGFGRKH